MIGGLNINALENKFEPLVSLVNGKRDVLRISETKIDATFPKEQFSIAGYPMHFRNDRNSHGGGLMLYLRDDIPCKQLKIRESPAPIEAMFIETIIRKSKWLLVVGYNPHKERIASFSSDTGVSYLHKMTLQKRIPSLCVIGV